MLAHVYRKGAGKYGLEELLSSKSTSIFYCMFHDDIVDDDEEPQAELCKNWVGKKGVLIFLTYQEPDIPLRNKPGFLCFRVYLYWYELTSGKSFGLYFR